jgi:hypothetical protein
MESHTEVLPINALRAFIGARQRHAVICGMAGEEKQFFVDKMAELAALVAAMPKTYEQESVSDPIVTLHYFAGSSDWYITEKDIDTDGQGQIQAFGLADLFGDGGELGYISIDEITKCGAELDFHFKPCPLSIVRDAPALTTREG